MSPSPNTDLLCAYYPDIDQGEVRGWLSMVESALAPEVLAASHPLHLLWRSGDRTSAAELFTLGWAIQRIGPRLKSPEIIRDLCSARVGDRAGAAFEIVLAALLHTGGQSVEIAPRDNPGWDLRLHLPSGKRLRHCH